MIHVLPSRVADDDVERLAVKVQHDLGSDYTRWFTPVGYRSVALAVIDSIYSTGNRYGSVVNAINRYRAARLVEGGEPEQDSASDLVLAVERWGGVEGLVQRTNRCRAWARKEAPYKAEVAYAAAHVLNRHGLNTQAQVRSALASTRAPEKVPVEEDWGRLPGQRSLVTWTYFLMLCGVPGVKPDRRVVAYVTEALGRRVFPGEAGSLVGELSDRLGVKRTNLDHAIWRHQSGRPVFINA